MWAVQVSVCVLSLLINVWEMGRAGRAQWIQASSPWCFVLFCRSSRGEGACKANPCNCGTPWVQPWEQPQHSGTLLWPCAAAGELLWELLSAAKCPFCSVSAQSDTAQPDLQPCHVWLTLSKRPFAQHQPVCSPGNYLPSQCVLTSGKLVMFTTMSCGDFCEICPSWFSGNFPSFVTTVMWSRAPQKNQTQGGSVR